MVRCRFQDSFVAYIGNRGTLKQLFRGFLPSHVDDLARSTLKRLRQGVIPTQACWSNLPFFPYTPHGWPDLFAYRVALLRRRNQAEAAFSSLQVGYKEGLDGAARARLVDLTENEAPIGLSFGTRGLLVLSAVR